jgi:hypothetical protein
MRDGCDSWITPVVGPGLSCLAGPPDCIGAGSAKGACRLDWERA